MSEPLIPLAQDFPAPDEAQWRALAQAGLKGAPWERLITRLRDEVSIAPLYREPDFASSRGASGAPGAAPFTRGAEAARDPYLPWRIQQRFAHPDAQRVNAEILADLEGGVSAIELCVDPAGRMGAALAAPTDVEAALAGVRLDFAPIGFEWLGEDWFDSLSVMTRALAGRPKGLAFWNIDPIGALMRTGEMAGDQLKLAARESDPARAAFGEGSTGLRVDARCVHEAGGSPAQELGAALASGLAYLRALEGIGVGADVAPARLMFAVSVGPDVLVETAKLRALRLCWAKLTAAAGEPAPARIHAFSSTRMMSRRDAWTNLLRVTAASFAAAIAGAEAITSLPLTEASGLPDAFARRLARNTQLILMEECRLGHVIDPAGGSWFVERLTQDFAGAAWAEFQAIEAAGGIVSALKAGMVQERVATAREAQMQAIAKRRETITGVSDFPLLEGREPDHVERPGQPARPFRPQDQIAAPLAPIRWAEPFEKLRDAITVHEGPRAVFFANLGPLAEFSARANFAQNLFAAGGVAAIDPEAVYLELDALVQAYRQSHATVAVLCGADARYASDAAPAAQALKSAGCAWLIYAGKPGDEAALRAAGVDQFIFAGQDALAALRTLLAALGVEA